MAKLSSDELLDAFKEMTLIELSEFVKSFEETFGVTAAAPVAVAAAGGGAVPLLRPRPRRRRTSSTSSSRPPATRRSRSSRRSARSPASASRRPRTSSTRRRRPSSRRSTRTRPRRRRRPSRAPAPPSPSSSTNALSAGPHGASAQVRAGLPGNRHPALTGCRPRGRGRNLSPLRPFGCLTWEQTGGTLSLRSVMPSHWAVTSDFSGDRFWSWTAVWQLATLHFCRAITPPLPWAISMSRGVVCLAPRRPHGSLLAPPSTA